MECGGGGVEGASLLAAELLLWQRATFSRDTRLTSHTALFPKQCLSVQKFCVGRLTCARRGRSLPNAHLVVFDYSESMVPGFFLTIWLPKNTDFFLYFHFNDQSPSQLRLPSKKNGTSMHLQKSSNKKNLENLVLYKKC